jgi:hypothetical protein
MKKSRSTGKELKDATELVTFSHIDDWSRPVFETKSGIPVVSVDGELYSINDPDGWAEPCSPLGYETPPLPDHINLKAVCV